MITGPMLPGRVRQRVGDGDVGQLCRGAAPERSPARGEDKAAHLVAPPAAQALGEGGVLAVDRDQPVRLAGDQTIDQRAADDQRLLVGQRECAPGVSAASVGARPIDPVIPLSTTSQAHAATCSAASGPARIAGSSTCPALQPAAFAAA